mmetsp:Transcript_17337/g.45054  ORF Transcript_17337/g.45054 Transcript_17337/m.45054 type:complete len:341 (+) Transcript_17337:763-1785(+)
MQVILGFAAGSSAILKRPDFVVFGSLAVRIRAPQLICEAALHGVPVLVQAVLLILHSMPDSEAILMVFLAGVLQEALQVAYGALQSIHLMPDLFDVEEERVICLFQRFFLGKHQLIVGTFATNRLPSSLTVCLHAAQPLSLFFLIAGARALGIGVPIIRVRGLIPAAVCICVFVFSGVYAITIVIVHGRKLLPGLVLLSGHVFSFSKRRMCDEGPRQHLRVTVRAYVPFSSGARSRRRHFGRKAQFPGSAPLQGAAAAPALGHASRATAGLLLQPLQQAVGPAAWSHPGRFCVLLAHDGGGLVGGRGPRFPRLGIYRPADLRTLASRLRDFIFRRALVPQ